MEISENLIKIYNHSAIVNLRFQNNEGAQALDTILTKRQIRFLTKTKVFSDQK